MASKNTKTSKHPPKPTKKPASITKKHASVLGSLGGRPRKDGTQTFKPNFGSPR